MDDYGKLLLEWYMKGFNDELWGNTSVDPQDKLLMKAYMIGADDALIGDDISSVDETPPRFDTIWETASKMNQDGEISELQLRKIFRILSGMRNNGHITLK